METPKDNTGKQGGDPVSRWKVGFMPFTPSMENDVPSSDHDSFKLAREFHIEINAEWNSPPLENDVVNVPADVVDRAFEDVEEAE